MSAASTKPVWYCTRSLPFINKEVSFNTMPRTRHALKRMAQRNLSERDVEYVLTHGCREFRGGVEFRYLRKRDISPQDQSEFARLEGTAIVVGSASEPDVITVWRNRKHGLRHIRRKCKDHFWRRPSGTLPQSE